MSPIRAAAPAVSLFLVGCTHATPVPAPNPPLAFPATSNPSTTLPPAPPSSSTPVGQVPQAIVGDWCGGPNDTVGGHWTWSFDADGNFAAHNDRSSFAGVAVVRYSEITLYVPGRDPQPMSISMQDSPDLGPTFFLDEFSYVQGQCYPLVSKIESLPARVHVHLVSATDGPVENFTVTTHIAAACITTVLTPRSCPGQPAPRASALCSGATATSDPIGPAPPRMANDGVTSRPMATRTARLRTPSDAQPVPTAALSRRIPRVRPAVLNGFARAECSGVPACSPGILAAAYDRGLTLATCARGGSPVIPRFAAGIYVQSVRGTGRGTAQGITAQ
jgi:hypothetical protein